MNLHFSLSFFHRSLLELFHDQGTCLRLIGDIKWRVRLFRKNVNHCVHRPLAEFALSAQNFSCNEVSPTEPAAWSSELPLRLLDKLALPALSCVSRFRAGVSLPRR